MFSQGPDLSVHMVVASNSKHGSYELQSIIWRIHEDSLCGQYDEPHYLDPPTYLH